MRKCGICRCDTNFDTDTPMTRRRVKSETSSQACMPNVVENSRFRRAAVVTPGFVSHPEVIPPLSFQSRLRSRYLRTSRRGSQGIKMSKLRNGLERSRRGVDAVSNLVDECRSTVAKESRGLADVHNSIGIEPHQA